MKYALILDWRLENSAPCGEKGSFERQRLIEEAEKSGYVGLAMSPTAAKYFHFFIKRPISHDDLLITRFVSGYSSSQFSDLKQLEDMGHKTMNRPEGLKLAEDKWETHKLLEKIHIPTAKTMRLSDWQASYWEGHQKLIIKPKDGLSGEGVELIDDTSQVEKWQRLPGADNLLVQEFLPRGNEDIRLLVIGNKCLGGIVRRSAAGEFRSNLSLGGSAERLVVSPEMAALAIRATKAIGLDYAGVDLMWNRTGSLIVNEVNGTPGFLGTEPILKINIAKEIIKHARDLRSQAQQPAKIDYRFNYQKRTVISM